MEVFFCSCPQFFTPCIQNGGRKGQQTQQSFHHRGQPVAQGQKEGAEDLEIEDRAGEYRAHHIEPHHAALQEQGVEEECGGDQHPEQEVQQPRQQREGQAAAQDAEALLLREWETEDCRRRSCGGLVRQMFDEAAERLLEDEENCKRLDDMFRDVCVRAALYEHAFIGETAEQVLSAYDKERLNDFIYSKVRDELGWIRINGTLVAAVAGSLLLSAFSAFHLIP